MRTVALFSALLAAGMLAAQFAPHMLGDAYALWRHAVNLLTMIGLAFIMIHVGYEFEIDKGAMGQYAWDYVVAATAATFPWVLASLYFLLVMLPTQHWTDFEAYKEILLVGRFAAPTSAGLLFAMLAAAGLSATWLFRKARVLAIFDDLDTVLLMIPLKVLMVGWAWHLGATVLVMLLLVWLAWHFLHRWAIPVSWPWVMSYAAATAVGCELIHFGSKLFAREPIHIEVLLPAFVLGCMLRRPEGSDPHADDAREGHQEGPESPDEQRAAFWVSAVFIALVGLSMPNLLGSPAAAAESMDEARSATVSAQQAFPGWDLIAAHVVALTVLINLGKMFPLVCYRREATLRERLALSIGLWPRGEVGAGVLILSLSYGIGGPLVTVAMLCLALNLVLTGVYIVAVKWLLRSPAAPSTPA